MSRPSNLEIKVAEEIIDEAIMNNKPHYLIKWKYFSHQFDTWESLECLESITGMLQKWIRNRRQNKQAILFNNVSSYCDTVNYIDPAKRTKRKRKIISKRKPSKSPQNQIVVLDEEDSPEHNTFSKSHHSDSFINDQEESEILEEKNQMKGKPERQPNWNTQELFDTCEEDKPELQNYTKQKVEPLKFDPEEEDKKAASEPESQQKLKPGMKVVGKIRSEDVQTIFERFQFRDDWCCKLQLKDGRVTNMREKDLKNLCPQMLMEFYEENDIKI